MAIVIFGFTTMGIAVLGCCIICILFAMGFGAMLHLRRMQALAGVGDDNGPRGATEEEIAAMPCKTYREGLIDGPEATCSICFGDYIPGEEVRFLPCHHHFHAACVDTWLTGSRACPICKHPIDQPAPDTAYNPAPSLKSSKDDSTRQRSSEDDEPGAAAAITTTTTTTGVVDYMDQEDAPFVAHESSSPNMGTFVEMPK